MPDVVYTGCTVYLGAGLASDLETIRTASGDRVCLVEPNPDLREDLTLLAEEHADVDYLECGVTPEGAPAALDVYNMFDLSSFSAPQDLFDVFPGAVLQNSAQVQTLTPNALIERCALTDARAHTLVIDTPGLEYDLLSAFLQEDALAPFRSLIVRLPAEPLFAGSRPPADLVALAESAGFRLALAAPSPEAHDWHVLTGQFNETWNDLRRLEADMAALADKHKKEQAKRRALEKRLDAEKKSTAQLKKQTAALEQDVEEARADKAAALQGGEAARQTGAEALETLKAEMARITAERDDAARTAAQKYAQLDTKMSDLQTAHDTSAAEHTAARTALKTAHAQIEALQERPTVEAYAALQTSIEERESQLKNDISALQAAHEQEKARHRVLETQLKQTTAERDAALAELSDMTTERDTAVRAQNNQASAYNAATAQAEALTRDRDTAKRQFSEQVEAFEALAEQHRDLTAKHDEAARKAAEEVTKLAGALSDLQTEHDKAAADRDAARTALKEAEAQTKALRERPTVEAQTELRMSIEKLEQRLGHTERSTAEFLEKADQESRHTAAEAKRAIELAAESTRTQEARLTELLAELADARSLTAETAKSADAALASANAEKAAAAAAKDALTKLQTESTVELTRMKDKISRLEDEVAERRTEMTELSTALETARADLKVALAEKDTALKSLQTRLREMTRDFEETTALHTRDRDALIAARTEATLLRKALEDSLSRSD